MILVVDALNRHRFTTLLDQMYELRARVFRDRLGWEVKVQDGREIDLFDDLDPAYLLSLDENYNVVGCNRMLQTTGPHMLADVFDAILDGQPPLRSATVWENTRFCIDAKRIGANRTGKSVSYTACELMLGIAEYAYDSGISDVISVVDPAMDRVMKRCNNAPYDYLGKTVQMGKTRALAALSDITEGRIARIRNFAGITGNIFLDENEVAEVLNARQTLAGMPDDLRTYCSEQIESATDDCERQAAIALQKALAGMAHPRRVCDA